jgi:uncharacterized LabA/DUF88 family protein
MGVTHAPVRPIQFQRAMVFIDGTNLFHRLEAAKLNLTQDLSHILTAFLDRRQIVRIYLYTIAEHMNKAKGFHGNQRMTTSFDSEHGYCGRFNIRRLRYCC